MIESGNFFPKFCRYKLHSFGSKVVISGFSENQGSTSLVFNNYSSKHFSFISQLVNKGILAIHYNAENSKQQIVKLKGQLYQKNMEQSSNQFTNNNSFINIYTPYRKSNQANLKIDNLQKIFQCKKLSYSITETESFFIEKYTNNTTIEAQLLDKYFTIHHGNEQSQNPYKTMINIGENKYISALKKPMSSLSENSYLTPNVIIYFREQIDASFSKGFILYDIQKMGKTYSFERKQWILSENPVIISENLVINAYQNIRDFSSSIKLFDIRTLSHVLTLDGSIQENNEDLSPWTPNYAYMDQTSAMRIGTVWTANFTRSKLQEIDIRFPFRRIQLTQKLYKSIRFFKRNNNHLWVVDNVYDNYKFIGNSIHCDQLYNLQ